MNAATIKLEPTKDCCPQWPILKAAFGWIKLKDSHYGIMPYLEISGCKWRIKRCPSCGSDVMNTVTMIDDNWK